MPCPFGFTAPPPDGSDVSDAGDKTKKKAKKDDRFDYNKDPISWFYQNQIRSEEEFQQKKAALREQARCKLDEVFHKKGKQLIIDSDEDFSISSGELSAWDSDIASLCSMQSAADSWAAETEFAAPAYNNFRLALLIMLASSLYCFWQALQAVLHVNRFWGIVDHGWVPAASLALSLIASFGTIVSWTTLAGRNRRHLLFVQLNLQLVYASAIMLAMVCRTHPSQVDEEIQSSVCGRVKVTEDTSKLCRYIPLVEEQIIAAMWSIFTGNVALALSGFATAGAAVWYQWELGYVKIKASKHRRRHKRRKTSIPWDKIKIAEVTPMGWAGPCRPPVEIPSSKKKA